MPLKTFHHKTVEILRIYTEVLDFIMLFSTEGLAKLLNQAEFSGKKYQKKTLKSSLLI
jgi:hypothetical protein